MKKFQPDIWVDNALKILYIIGLCTILLLVLFFQLCSHLWRQCSMAMVFSVCPGRFRTAQTLAVGTDKPGGTISVTDSDYDKISGMSESEEKKLTVGFEQ
jgi:hypothetical protein